MPVGRGTQRPSSSFYIEIPVSNKGTSTGQPASITRLNQAVSALVPAAGTSQSSDATLCPPRSGQTPVSPVRLELSPPNSEDEDESWEGEPPIPSLLTRANGSSPCPLNGDRSLLPTLHSPAASPASISVGSSATRAPTSPQLGSSSTNFFKHSLAPSRTHEGNSADGSSPRQFNGNRSSLPPVQSPVASPPSVWDLSSATRAPTSPQPGPASVNASKYSHAPNNPHEVNNTQTSAQSTLTRIPTGSRGASPLTTTPPAPGIHVFLHLALQKSRGDPVHISRLCRIL
ncbi:hypothetical protein CF326_g10074, partial [Tilletia indica]